ncbi:hypothetical protein BDM02DRAFT_2987132 [Thelephora ganbajun]|uniref:Uncharacterized protein n=1 Tax=Thelephora ganbajun TaxID=370292 RepID=A0ACB6ZAG7_THEGA|nr:hypothetical protein BDM02DRAFT_2987132 [Thelephora ganbajun]
MRRLFGKKSKKSAKPSPKPISLGITTDVAAGPLRSREEPGIVPDGEQIRFYHDLELNRPDSMVILGERNNVDSRIIFQDNSSEGKDLPVPEASTSGVVVGGTEHRNDPTGENAADIREGEGGVPEREYENTALTTTTTILSVPKEAPHESSPLGPLKAVLRTLAAVHANHQETIGIGNKVEGLLSRIVGLEERFYSRPDDVEEQRRRSQLLCEFGRIEGKLRPLSEKSEPRQPAEYAQDNEGVYGLLEDLRENIFNYQMVQQEEIYDQRRKLIKPGQKTPTFGGRGLR